MKAPYGMTIMEKTAFPHGCGPGRERAGGGRASMPRLAVGEGVLGAQTPVYFPSPQLPRILPIPPLPSRGKACLVWEDGQFKHSRATFPVEVTTRKIFSLPLAPEIKTDLATILRTGSNLPEPIVERGQGDGSANRNLNGNMKVDSERK